MHKLFFGFALLCANAHAQSAGGTLASGATWDFSSGAGGAAANYKCVDPGDSVNPPWCEGVVMMPNGVGQPLNPVLYNGWNCGPNGEMVAGKGRVCASYEGNFMIGNVSHREVNFGAFNGVPGSPFYRWLSMMIENNTLTPNVRVGISGDQVSIGGRDNMSTPGQIDVNRFNAYFRSPNQDNAAYVDDQMLQLYAGIMKVYLTAAGLMLQAHTVPSVDKTYVLGTSGNNVGLRKRFSEVNAVIGKFHGTLAERPPCNWDNETAFYTVDAVYLVSPSVFYQCCADVSGIIGWKPGLC